MPEQLVFAMEVFLNGLMAGVLYALVALGFVLIFKASGIFNYAQGVMALFSAMTLVGIMKGQVPFAHVINAIFRHGCALLWMDRACAACDHIDCRRHGAVCLGCAEIHLPPLGRAGADHPVHGTIGLAYFLEGVGDLMWNSEIKKLDVGLPQGINEAIDNYTFNIFDYGFFIDNLDIVATVDCRAFGWWSCDLLAVLQRGPRDAGCRG